MRTVACSDRDASITLRMCAGAYYYGDPYQSPATGGPPHWLGGYDYNLTCCTKAKLMAAKRALDKDDVPITYLQLDDWSVYRHSVSPATLCHLT